MAVCVATCVAVEVQQHSRISRDSTFMCCVLCHVVSVAACVAVCVAVCLAVCVAAAEG